MMPVRTRLACHLCRRSHCRGGQPSALRNHPLLAPTFGVKTVRAIEMVYSQITALTCGTTIALGDRKITETRLTILDLALVPTNDVAGVILGPGDVGFTPRGRPPRSLVLHQEVRTSDLALEVGLRGPVRAEVGSVILSHVVLQRLAVGARWRLPP